MKYLLFILSSPTYLKQRREGRKQVNKGEWMGRWMDGWVGVWTDGWMDGRKKGREDMKPKWLVSPYLSLLHSFLLLSLITIKGHSLIIPYNMSLKYQIMTKPHTSKPNLSCAYDP